MATELENRFIINNEECMYATDANPEYKSTAFVTSGGVYENFLPLQQYTTRNVVNSSTDYVANSTNIPTVGLMYSKIEALAARVTALENS